MRNSCIINFSLVALLLLATNVVTAKNHFKLNKKKQINYKTILEDCTPALAHSTLEVNNIKAHLGAGGEIFYDASIVSAGYEAPKGSGIYAIFAGANWLGALDDEGNLKLAAPTYRVGEEGVALDDLWPGPLYENGETNQSTCAQYDEVWEISKTEIDDFKADLNDGMLDNELSENFKTWKGPFVDEDGDGNYNPTQGDYPKIKGEAASWYVTNDKGNVHTAANQSEALGIQLETMVYAYNTAGLNNTTFVEYQIINKSLDNLNKMYFGTWLDPDLGFYEDDYLGCDTIRNLAICYNGDDYDDEGENPMSPQGYGENPPFLGLQILDGITNDEGMKLGLSSFIYYEDEALVGQRTPQTDPLVADDYYRYLQGIWKDGTPISAEAKGYDVNNTNHTKFVYPAEPSNELGWSECAIGNEPGDRKFVMASGPFTMRNGETKSLTQAVLWVRPFGAFEQGCPSFDAIQKQADFVFDFYDETILGGSLPVIIFDGPTEITIPLGSESWDLPTATATDGLDGTLPVNINISQVDVNTPGEYSVIYSTFDSDGNTVIEIITVIVSDEVSVDDALLQHINIYPNPTVDFINVNLSDLKATEILIYNYSGTLLLNSNLTPHQINTIEVADLNAGVYLYTIIKEDKLISKGKFVKQ